MQLHRKKIKNKKITIEKVEITKKKPKIPNNRHVVYKKKMGTFLKWVKC